MDKNDGKKLVINGHRGCLKVAPKFRSLGLLTTVQERNLTARCLSSFISPARYESADFLRRIAQQSRALTDLEKFQRAHAVVGDDDEGLAGLITDTLLGITVR